jgi:energy-coupling factor transporter ATP-binding protein EcfA2
MPRFFNTAGTCVPDRHYMIPPERRLEQVRSLIEHGLFFVIHAPRQTGKTTLLHALARALNQEGRYTSLVISVENLRRTTDVREGNLSLIHHLHADSRFLLPAAEHAPDLATFGVNPHSALHDFLRAWSASCPKPLVLFLDEIDSLPEDLLLSVLSQLRMGYTGRAAAPFVHSLALVGLRDVRDYRIRLRPNSASMGTASPFNIKSDSLTLRNFSRDDVAELYGQHTADTGS